MSTFDPKRRLHGVFDLLYCIQWRNTAADDKRGHGEVKVVWDFDNKLGEAYNHVIFVPIM